MELVRTPHEVAACERENEGASPDSRGVSARLSRDRIDSKCIEEVDEPYVCVSPFGERNHPATQARTTTTKPMRILQLQYGMLATRSSRSI